MIVYVEFLILIIACRWTMTNAGTRILIPRNYEMPSDYVASVTRRGKITTMTVHPRFVSRIRMYADMKDHWQQGTAIEPTGSMENSDYNGDGTTEPGGVRSLPRRRYTGNSRDLMQPCRPRVCNCRPRSCGRRPQPCGCRPRPTTARNRVPCRTAATCGCHCPTTVCKPAPSCTTCAPRSTTVGCATTRPYRCPCSDDENHELIDRYDDDDDDDDDDDADLSRAPPPTGHSCRTTTLCSAATASIRGTSRKRKSRPKLRTTRLPRPLIRYTCGCHLPPSFLHRKADAAAVTGADLIGSSTDHVGLFKVGPMR